MGIWITGESKFSGEATKLNFSTNSLYIKPDLKFTSPPFSNSDAKQGRTLLLQPELVGTKMEFANRLVGAAMRATNNNTVINVCLVGSFLALSVRSMNQQKDIEALEAEKDSLRKSNKAMKKTMWDWKQQLFAEAESDAALVPLARLKAIYGEAPSPPIGTLSIS